MSKNNKPKKVIDPNVVNESLETSSDEVLTNEVTEEVVEETPVAETPVEEVKEEVVEAPVEEVPVAESVVEEVKEEEPVPVPVEPGPVIIDEPKEEVVEAPTDPEPVKEETPAPVEKSEFKEAFVVCIYATARKSVDDISDELNTNRRFVAENIIIDRVSNRVVLETSNNVDVLRKIQKKYLAAGIKTVIAKA